MSQAPPVGAIRNLDQHVGGPIDTGLSRIYEITLQMAPEDALENDLYYQHKAPLCTRLQFYCDIRCPPDEQWIMQEGSLVVGIQREFVGILPQPSAKDELVVRLGRIYVIVYMYADLWAYCIDVSFDVNKEDTGSFNAGFLPLWAVTLPANLDAFLDRCGGRYSDEYGLEPAYPWTGQVAVPPKRSHSRKAAAEIMQPGYELPLKPMTQELLKNFAPLSSAGGSVVPLDAPVKDLLVKMMEETKLSSRLRRVLKRWETRARVGSFVPRQVRGLPSTRYTHQGSSLFEPAVNSTRSGEDQQQPERPSRSETVYRALSRSLAKLVGLLNNRAPVSGSLENCV